MVHRSLLICALFTTSCTAMPDEDAKVREYARFVEDLRIAADVLNAQTAA